MPHQSAAVQAEYALMIAREPTTPKHTSAWASSVPAEDSDHLRAQITIDRIGAPVEPTQSNFRDGGHPECLECRILERVTRRGHRLIVARAAVAAHLKAARTPTLTREPELPYEAPLSPLGGPLCDFTAPEALLCVRFPVPSLY